MKVKNYHQQILSFKNANMGIPFLSFYSTILASYFTSDHFLPAYLETMGPIIPDALIKYINDTEGVNYYLALNPDGSSVGWCLLKKHKQNLILVFLLISL